MRLSASLVTAALCAASSTAQAQTPASFPFGTVLGGSHNGSGKGTACSVNSGPSSFAASSVANTDLMTFKDLRILLPPKNGVPVEYDYYGLARLVFSTGNSGSMIFDAASASGAKLPSLTFSDFVAAYDQTGGTLNVTFSVSFAGKCVLPVSAIYRTTM